MEKGNREKRPLGAVEWVGSSLGGIREGGYCEKSAMLHIHNHAVPAEKSLEENAGEGKMGKSVFRGAVQHLKLKKGSQEGIREPHRNNCGDLLFRNRSGVRRGGKGVSEQKKVQAICSKRSKR